MLASLTDCRRGATEPDDTDRVIFISDAEGDPVNIPILK
jgi:hypothetical protein